MNTVKGEKRKIIHCDADCFYAALETREDPSLRGRPMAVGGAGRRGVLSTANYEARQFGVRSAMPSAYARRLCPDLIIVPPNFPLYKEASMVMRDIFHEYCDLVEPLSLDEAFIDVSHVDKCRGSATLMAQDIREKIRAQLGITVSAGVAPNKFLAKVASDWKKPDGLTVITPDSVDDFIKQLPVKKIFGVGKVTAAKMQRLGISTCFDLQQYDQVWLTKEFGSMGLSLYNLCRGIDKRKVRSEWRRKSLSVEHTYSEDIAELNGCLSAVPSLLQQLSSRLRRLDGEYRVVKSFVKVKFNDFVSTTMERIGSKANLHDYRELCAEAFQRGNRPVRLLGLGVRLMDLKGNEKQQQLDLFQNNFTTVEL